MQKELQHKSVLVMILLFIITYGIYLPVWFLKNKEALNNLNSKEKLDSQRVIFVLVLFIISAILLIPSVIFDGTPTGEMIDNLDSVINLVSGAGLILISFKVRKILSEHYQTTMSGVATFFFNCFYLQHKINTLIQKKGNDSKYLQKG